jgi:hypothetical protein
LLYPEVRVRIDAYPCIEFVPSDLARSSAMGVATSRDTIGDQKGFSPCSFSTAVDQLADGLDFCLHVHA